MSPYFVLIISCGYFTCADSPPKEIVFDNRDACVQFVKNFDRAGKTGITVTCIDRIEGKMIADNKGEKK